MAHDHIVAGIHAALSAGALTAESVAIEARKAAQTEPRTEPIPPPRAAPTPVTSLTVRRLANLPPDTRPVPSVAAYDQLLRHRRGAPPAQ